MKWSHVVYFQKRAIWIHFEQVEFPFPELFFRMLMFSYHLPCTEESRCHVFSSVCCHLTSCTIDAEEHCTISMLKCSVFFYSLCTKTEMYR